MGQSVALCSCCGGGVRGDDRRGGVGSSSRAASACISATESVCAACIHGSCSKRTFVQQGWGGCDVLEGQHAAVSRTGIFIRGTSSAIILCGLLSRAALVHCARVLLLLRTQAAARSLDLAKLS